MRSLESLALAAACAHAAAGFQAGMSGAGLRTARPLGAPRRGLELGGGRHRIRTASLRMQAQADDDTGLGGMAAGVLERIDSELVQPVAESISAGADLITPLDSIVEPLAQTELANTLDRIGEYTPEPSKKDSRLGLLAAAALSGSGYAAVRMIGDSVDSSSILAIRFVVAAAVLSPWLFKCNKEVLRVSIETGGWLAIGYVAQAVCLQTSSAGAAAFLASLTTVVCPVIERLTGKRLDKKAWTAMVLAVLGAFALEFGAGEMPHANDLVGLLQPLLFGVYLFKTEQALEEHPDQGLPITAVQTSVTALATVGWWGYWHQQGLAAPAPEVLAQATSEAASSLSPALPTLDAVKEAVRGLPVIDLLGPAQPADEAQMILGAIKSTPSVVQQAGAEPVRDDVMLLVDAMMNPIADLTTNSYQAASAVVPDGVADSVVFVPDGVSEALGNAKLWATGTKVFALAWLGVLSSAAVLAAESVAVGKLSSSETAVVFSTEPLWAAAMGSLMLGEQIGANTFVGGALVLAACISRVASPQELSTLWQTKMGEARSTLEKARFPSK